MLKNETSMNKATISEIKDASGKIYRASIFFAQAQAAYAKAVIFLAEAKIAIKSKQYILAAISAYYSLFHLSISLMYIVPTFIKQDLVIKLVIKLQRGIDPTVIIQHRDLLFSFLCVNRMV